MRREKNILIQTIRYFECFCIARDRDTAAGITYIYYTASPTVAMVTMNKVHGGASPVGRRP